MPVFCSFIVILFLLLLLFLIFLGWRFLRLLKKPPVSMRRGKTTPLNVCIVLGSGGHTSEMMRSIKELPPGLWRANRPFYIISETDKHSENLARDFEETQFRRCCRFHTIPRAREVGQNYFFSIFTTFYAFISSLKVIILEKPDIILVNGPGVCVPVVMASLLITLLSPSWYFNRPGIIFMESFTCVKHMSLSGKLLAPFCDIFTVQWKELFDLYRNKWWAKKNKFFFVGVPQKDLELIPKLIGEEITSTQVKDKIALVTVGSTQFNSLINAIDDEEVYKILSKRGITRLLIQKGVSSYNINLKNTYGINVEVFAYRPKLQEIIKEASLIISHAGAGTILESLEFKKPLIVVPNRDLMSDHQLELAEALGEARYLFCIQVWDIRKKLQTLNFDNLLVFSGTNTLALKEVILPLFGFTDTLQKEH